MECYCPHQKVCKWRKPLIDAFKPLLELRFGGVDPAWEEFARVIRNNCEHKAREEANSES